MSKKAVASPSSSPAASARAADGGAGVTLPDVRKHQFRDDDKSAPNIKTARRPEAWSAPEETTDASGRPRSTSTSVIKGGDDKGEIVSVTRTASGKKIITRKRSVTVLVRVRAHQHRDDDKSAPNIKTDRKPRDIADASAGSKRKSSTSSEPSVPVKARRHQFRDSDASLPPVTVQDSKYSARTAEDAAAVEKSKKKVVERQRKLRDKHHERQEQGKAPVAARVTPPRRTNSTSAEKQQQLTPSPPSASKNDDDSKSPGVTRKTSNVTRLERKNVSFGDSAEEDMSKSMNAKGRLARAASTVGGGGSGGGGSGGSLTALVQQQQVAATSGGGGGVDSFPRQPKCRPDDLSLPVKKLTELLWDKYAVVPKGSTSTETLGFPIAKIESGLAKLWPGNALTAEMIEECVDVLLLDRSAASAAADESGGLDPTSSQQFSVSSAGVMMATEVNVVSSTALPTTAGVAAATTFFIPPTDLDDKHLSEREYNNMLKLVSMYNNWMHCLPADTHRRALDIDSYAKVADTLRLEGAAKLYMQLTSGGTKDLSLCRLCRHFALNP